MAMLPWLTGMWYMKALMQPVSGLGNVLSRWHRLSCRQQEAFLGGGGVEVRADCLACRLATASHCQLALALQDMQWQTANQSHAICLKQCGGRC